MRNEQSNNDFLEIAGKKFSSRLFVGTGKFSSIDTMKKAIDGCGTEMVTVGDLPNLSVPYTQ